MNMFKKAYAKNKKPFDNALHTATCSGCGKECQVPFKPNGKKPVFCSACYVREEKTGERPERAAGSNFYEKKSAYQSRPHARPDSRPSLNGITTEQFKSLNMKLDTIITLLRGDE
jgi:CxxC-x17-CxxC domain-containing protein